MKLKIEKGGNDSLSLEHKEEIKVIFCKSLDLLTSRILNINPRTFFINPIIFLCLFSVIYPNISIMFKIIQSGTA